ncbi:hypothetical protein [Rhodococcus opacus]|nr:hypothetical protein [Rhodococcus opacus]
MAMTLATFEPIGRPSKLLNHTVWKPVSPPNAPDRFLYLECSASIAKQFRMLNMGCVENEVPVTAHPELARFDYRFDWVFGVPKSVDTMVGLLKEVLTLGRRQHIDFTLALDWYSTAPEPGSTVFGKTEAGALVNKGKYWSDGPEKRRARGKIAESLADVIGRHPLLQSAPTVVTVPGSKADFSSFGESLARHMAERTAKKLVQTQCRSGARPPRKEDSSVELIGEFVLPGTVAGPVLIIDDVYKSGESMNAVALAARQAGASAVYGLAIAKTMAN